MHKAGWVHRDVRAANFFLTEGKSRDGSQNRSSLSDGTPLGHPDVMLNDFGSAVRIADGAVKYTGAPGEHRHPGIRGSREVPVMPLPEYDLYSFLVALFRYRFGF